MAKRMESTPKKDGFRMPAEFEPQEKVWMVWPERCDNWRNGAKPAQQAYANIAKAISTVTPVTMCVSAAQYANARGILPPEIRVVEISNDDAWVRDTGPTFVRNDKGEIRGVDWVFNAWGGLVDGLYFPWANDDAVAQKICDIEGIDSYRTHGFVCEGGSFHVDGEGTMITSEMCLLSEGRNPHLSKEEIEETLCEYLNLDKIIWIKDGIDPDETNGHIDDVACYVRPGEVACIYTEDQENQFYQACQDAYAQLSQAVDGKGRKLKVHKVCMPKKYVTIKGDFAIDSVDESVARKDGEVCIASYMNFLITNGALIVPQYGDENDSLALKELGEIFPDYKIIGVDSWEVVYGGGNIHCITQQQPK